MSAYIVDPRTIDYLVQWAGGRQDARFRVPATIAEEYMGQLTPREWTPLARLTPDTLGTILLRENVRSVAFRYPNDSADDLPGPCDQKRVWRYQWRPVPHEKMRATWVISSCDCLDYQSCETDDWSDTLAHAILKAIRESAVRALVGDDAPWGITDDDLSPKVTA